jgi:hypothetical protein
MARLVPGASKMEFGEVCGCVGVWVTEANITFSGDWVQFPLRCCQHHWLITQAAQSSSLTWPNASDATCPSLSFHRLSSA